MTAYVFWLDSQEFRDHCTAHGAVVSNNMDCCGAFLREKDSNDIVLRVIKSGGICIWCTHGVALVAGRVSFTRDCVNMPEMILFDLIIERLCLADACQCFRLSPSTTNLPWACFTSSLHLCLENYSR
jgi:hypothetical protein